MSPLVLLVVVAGLAATCAAAVWQLRQSAAPGARARERAQGLRAATADAVAALHRARALTVADAPDPVRPTGDSAGAPASDVPAADGAEVARRPEPAPLLRRDP